MVHVDVDVAKHAHSTCYIYFRAETTIIVSSNSESKDVRSRKVYTTLLARAKGKAFIRCCLRPVHTARRASQRTIYMKTANSTFQHDLIRHGQQYTVRVRVIYRPSNI